MAEYIDREVVKKMLESAQIITDGEYAGYCMDDISIYRIPAANVAPVVHGRWRWAGECGFNDCYICSECGKIAMNDSNYCPHCGAKMDKEGSQC